jgi:hypothetical protein
VTPRPPIPPDVKRALRQEAGFGCCKCGFPIYDYQHIIPYSVDPHFRVEDMMLLCPNHHREATLQAISETEQRRYKANPYNRRRGTAEGSLRINSSTVAVKLGTVNFVGDGTLLQVDEEDLIALHLGEERIVQLSASLYNRDGELLSLIHRNEWISGDPLPWDLEFGLTWITLRERSGLIALTIDARTLPLTVTGHFWYSGQHFRLSPTQGIIINGVVENLRVNRLSMICSKISVDTNRRSVGVGGWNNPTVGPLISGTSDIEEAILVWKRNVHPTWPWNYNNRLQT